MKEMILSEIKKLESMDQEWILNQLHGIVMENKKVSSPADIYSKYLLRYSNKKQEHFIVLELDGGNKVQKCRVVTKGLLNSSQVHPREVFADAIKNRCASIIIAHNHPSGNNEPSREDITVTKRIKEAGEILGISVLDHLIVSSTGYKSMLEAGYL